MPYPVSKAPANEANIRDIPIGNLPTNTAMANKAIMAIKAISSGFMGSMISYYLEI
jgi:hypothetical protein